MKQGNNRPRIPDRMEAVFAAILISFGCKPVLMSG